MVASRWSAPLARPRALMVSLVLAATLLASPARAATVQVETIDGQEVAVAIVGLLLGDAEYDVDFVFSSAEQLYGQPHVFTFDSREAANSAVDAINEALNDANIGLVGNQNGSTIRHHIGFEQVGINLRTRVGQMFTEWQNFSEAVVAGDRPSVYASFTPVPLPATLPLMGGAFAALLTLGWRLRSRTRGAAQPI